MGREWDGGSEREGGGGSEREGGGGSEREGMRVVKKLCI